MHVLDRCLGPLVSVVEFFECFEIIFGRKQLLALYTKHFRDEQGLLRDARIKRSETNVWAARGRPQRVNARGPAAI